MEDPDATLPVQSLAKSAFVPFRLKKLWAQPHVIHFWRWRRSSSCHHNGLRHLYVYRHSLTDYNPTNLSTQPTFLSSHILRSTRATSIIAQWHPVTASCALGIWGADSTSNTSLTSRTHIVRSIPDYVWWNFHEHQRLRSAQRDARYSSTYLSRKPLKVVPHFVQSRAVSDVLPRATPSKSSILFKFDKN
jgi:hypothetical protein